MRMKSFLIVFGCVVITSYVFVMIGSTREQNDSIKTIVTQTHRHIKEIQENLVSNNKILEIDSKYLSLLGFATPSASSSSSSTTLSSSLLPKQASSQHQINHNKSNFTVVSYVLSGQAASAISLIQNIGSKLPNETLILYDIGLSEDDSRALSTYCNNTKCTVITYDLSQFPTYVSDERMRAFRPLLIKDALNHSKTILFIENNVRIRSLTNEYRAELFHHVNSNGVLGWTTRLAVSSRTHPKMFDYFQTEAEDFNFLPMVSMDAVLFVDSDLVNEKILLPWIKCTLTLECIHPIGAQSGGCRFNKKPLYRYSGCHAYDVSAFNIVLGLTWNFDETKYSKRGEPKLYYLETLEQATKILENKRKNISDTSEHLFTNDD
ncbi:uncharacterized protein LOC116347052 [Contarinia nasturtii]|uniref:uncharacterized protein LOC116347052 n=1 Tax=Contarinia nasturtii TaxID=265458 RepID=UPI0012D4B25B|nr:uncharacterized protein LOC116347052 [Contarinia nasturtii]